MQASGGGDNTEVAERIKELQIKHEALRMEKQKFSRICTLKLLSAMHCCLRVRSR